MNAVAKIGRLALFGLLLGAPARARDTTFVVADDPPIELPKVEVVDTRILPLPESWQYAEIPGFEILANVSEHGARRFAQHFVELQQVVNTIMPMLTRGRSDVPTTLLLCSRGDGIRAFLPANRREARFGGNSLFFENAERTAIVVDLARSEIELEAGTRIEADPYRAFYAEYFRFLIRRQIGRQAPFWLEEGLVQLFSGIDFTDRWINFAQIGGGPDSAGAGAFNTRLVNHWLMPLPEMFAGEPGKTDPIWSVQCYGFVHMCLYGNNKQFRKPFIEFVSRLGGEPPTETLFRQCFHRSYRDMAIELRGYLQFTDYQYIRFKPKQKGRRLPAAPPVAVRDATDAEVGRLKGEVLRLAGHDDAAHLALIAPYIRGASDPRLLAALGLDELAAGREDRARKFLEAAARGGAVRARAYLELARLRYKAARAESAGAGVLTLKRFEAVMEPLAIARTQPPPQIGVYEMIARLWSESALPPTRQQLAVLTEGVQAFPRDANLLMQTIDLAAKNGFANDARALAERGARIFAAETAARERFTRQLEALPPPSPSPAPAAGASP